MQGLRRPETVKRVALNRLYELHGEGAILVRSAGVASTERRLHLLGPELAICWAFKRHIEMALAPLCLFIIVFQVVVQLILTDTITQQNCQSVRRRDSSPRYSSVRKSRFD